MAESNYEDLFNSDVVDVNGNKIGSIGQVYLDDQTGQPSWVTVKTGWFGLKETFVPLEQAVVTEGTITVPYTEEKVKEAPRVDPDKHLDADEEAQLYAYYGIATVLDSEHPVTAPAAGMQARTATADRDLDEAGSREVRDLPDEQRPEHTRGAVLDPEVVAENLKGAPAVGSPENRYGMEDYDRPLDQSDETPPNWEQREQLRDQPAGGEVRQPVGGDQPSRTTGGVDPDQSIRPSAATGGAVAEDEVPVAGAGNRQALAEEDEPVVAAPAAGTSLTDSRRGAPASDAEVVEDTIVEESLERDRRAGTDYQDPNRS
ncbi:PRC-barrel domain-containing protein [Brooklawnia sp.]|uniref:PRC-barrel domain-containing protein n=1 Tax=Brooklawnia sp. TaxID=2699740 RepID=UPI003C78A0D1